MHVLALTHITVTVTRITVSDEVLDYAHQELATLELSSRLLFLNFSLPHRSILLATPVIDTNKDSTSVQPSPGAHRRCYLLLVSCCFVVAVTFHQPRLRLSLLREISRRDFTPAYLTIKLLSGVLSGVKEQWCSPARVPTTVSDPLDTPLDSRWTVVKHTAVSNSQHSR